MASEINGLLSLSLLIHERLTGASTSQSRTDTTRLDAPYEFTDGTNADTKCDLVYVYLEQTLAAGATLSLDLAGSLKTPLSESAVFVKVVAIYVRNRSDGNGGVIKVGPPGAAGIASPWLAASDANVLV